MTNNQQLAVHCRGVIANPQDHLDWVVDMARVALASLEAKAVGYVSNNSRKSAADGHLGYISNHIVAGMEGGYVYDAPPVQVMQPVVPPNTTCVGWVKDAIEEHDAKWVEAIRTAGGSVKE